jgi:hypothetical protein
MLAGNAAAGRGQSALDSFNALAKWSRSSLGFVSDFDI